MKNTVAMKSRMESERSSVILSDSWQKANKNNERIVREKDNCKVLTRVKEKIGDKKKWDETAERERETRQEDGRNIRRRTATQRQRETERERKRERARKYIANNIDKRAEKYRSSIILPYPPRLFPGKICPFLFFFLFDMRPRRYGGKTFGFKIKHIVASRQKQPRDKSIVQ